MRGPDIQQQKLFSYLSPDSRVPQTHPLRPIRIMADKALKELSPMFRELYSRTGRPSIPPEQLLRSLLLQILYSIRSERMLTEQLDYNLLFRWFVGLQLGARAGVMTPAQANSRLHRSSGSVTVSPQPASRATAAIAVIV